jgi:hypothetical protein
MEGLYSINRPQFHQLVTHVSLYHDEPSNGFRELVRDCLERMGLRPSKLTVWNVPNMSTLMGKSIPVDVHGGFVLADEAALLESAKCYGMLRYALLAAAGRYKDGGRFRYDMITMNSALLVGCSAGCGFLYTGRRRWGWMRRRPIGSIFAAFAVCVATVGLTRMCMRTLGLGLIMAERGHKKALSKLKCVDCIDDVNSYTSEQIVELRDQKPPQSPPGMPPPPEAFMRQYALGIQKQIKLLEIDMAEVRVLRRDMKSHLCTLHKGLREAPDTFIDPSGFPILPSERAAAKNRAPLDGAPVLPSQS